MFTKPKSADSTPKTLSMALPNAQKLSNGKGMMQAAPTIISSDMTIDGSISSQGEVQVDGHVKGNIIAQKIVIGKTGYIEGELKAKTVTIRGRLIGTIKAEMVEIETGANVSSDILHTSFTIQANAIFTGKVTHSKEPVKFEPAKSLTKEAAAKPGIKSVSTSSAKTVP